MSEVTTIVAEPKNIRSIMPDGFLPRLATACKTHRSNISAVILDEKYTSRYWPHIEKIALESDPEGYRARMEFLYERDAYHRQAA